MNKFMNYITDEKNFKIVVPMIAVFSAFLVGTIIMLVTGENPLEAFKAILRAITGMNLDKIGTDKFFNSRMFGEFITTMLPITLTGLSVAFAFRTGLFNIGAEGQLMMGAMAATVVSILVKAPVFIHLPLVILASILAGALWGLIPGYLKAKFNMHEVVVTIMLNYTALYTSNLVLKALPGSDSVKTVKSQVTGTLRSEFLSDLTNGSRLHWGFVLVIIAVFAFWYIIEKTTFGYELRAVGFNKEGARYAGMKVNLNIMYSMAIAGAFAGLAGAMISVGTFDYGRVIAASEGYGFDGIAVALLGGNTAIGTIFGGALFGGLKASQPLMQSNGVPLEIAKIISSLMVLFVAMKFGIQEILKRQRLLAAKKEAK
ncbi:MULTISPECIES: ABC transporter permease [unclassified Fusibacter]|uniref:ABC transporter permease n=1 Tax=unclassified Fusibacter TaxID=2624464 RepID=UPI0010107313|nr:MULTISPECIES: ABC transporter permease [unclassified Fusibacter]MCK8059749.1 ABC transporter permease [Fusibacter sp. A2]NPE21550.1 ABC transporter permease [Fusibacter sp. A1]RXV61958.1 ABC transporter permease [Fusibacter sp. A1]